MARKRNADNRRLYLESMVAAVTGWTDPESRLRQAFENDEFILYGQAIVPLDRKRSLPMHLEILIRLGEEERNLTPPGAFLPMLEYCDMMPALDRWVIAHAVEWWRARKGVANTVLNVNLDPQTLGSPDFPAFVGKLLEDAGMGAAELCFELAGSEMAGGSPEAIESVQALKALGIQFAVTGFGRDTISFDALRTVGAGIVKMDGSIVREIHRDPLALAKVKSVQQVCVRAGLRTMAEFVEQQETLNLLREIGVDYVQGYGVAKPQPLAAAAAGVTK